MEIEKEGFRKAYYCKSIWVSVTDGYSDYIALLPIKEVTPIEIKFKRNPLKIKGVLTSDYKKIWWIKEDRSE